MSDSACKKEMRAQPWEATVEFDRRKCLRLAGAVGAVCVSRRIGFAYDYPTRPVRVIVAYAPGGQTDVVARLLAQKLSDQLGKQFYVENVPGAGGNIGMGRAAQAAADGYTLLMIDATAYVVNPNLYKKVPYDPSRDFAIVALPVTTSQILLVHPSLPVRSVKDLVALIKADPGKYSYASAGIGTPSHLTAELFRSSLGLDLVHVPFNGAGPAIASTLGGHTPIAFGSPASSIPQARQGSLRALAVAAKTRLEALPEVPTMAESGYPDVECNARVGLVAPTGTPQEAIALLNREIEALIALPDVKERLAELGFDAVANTPEEAAAIIGADSTKWARVVRQAQVKAE
jgi:tripartite-type tricarboxylate transporter receptor subunit TctC